MANIKKAYVREVVNPTCLNVQDQGQMYFSQQDRSTLMMLFIAGVDTPQMEKNRWDAWAWEGREMLRINLIGKLIEYRVVRDSGRGVIAEMWYRDGRNQKKSVAELLLGAGLAKVQKGPLTEFDARYRATMTESYKSAVQKKLCLHGSQKPSVCLNDVTRKCSPELAAQLVHDLKGQRIEIIVDLVNSETSFVVMLLEMKQRAAVILDSVAPILGLDEEQQKKLITNTCTSLVQRNNVFLEITGVSKKKPAALKGHIFKGDKHWQAVILEKGFVHLRETGARYRESLQEAARRGAAVLNEQPSPAAPQPAATPPPTALGAPKEPSVAPSPSSTTPQKKQILTTEEKLFEAIACCDATAVRDLLEKGADAHARTPSGETTLIRAAQAGDVDICMLLLLRDVDMHAASDDGVTVFHVAMERGLREVALQLTMLALGDVPQGALDLAQPALRREIKARQDALGPDAGWGEARAELQPGPSRDAGKPQMRRVEGSVDTSSMAAESVEGTSSVGSLARPDAEPRAHAAASEKYVAPNLSCSLCGVTNLNSKIQYEQHMNGAKHRREEAKHARSAAEASGADEQHPPKVKIQEAWSGDSGLGPSTPPASSPRIADIRVAPSAHVLSMPWVPPGVQADPAPPVAHVSFGAVGNPAPVPAPSPLLSTEGHADDVGRRAAALLDRIESLQARVDSVVDDAERLVRATRAGPPHARSTLDMNHHASTQEDDGW